MADAAQPQGNRNLARQHADDRHRDGVRRHLLAALEEEVVIVPLADVDPAAAAADHDAGIRLRDLQSGIRPGFARGDHADERGARVALGIGAVGDIPDVVASQRRHVVDRHAGDRRRDLAVEVRRVELGDRARAAAAAADVIPEALAADAERRHHADARDDDARRAGLRHDDIVVREMGARMLVWAAARCSSRRSPSPAGGTASILGRALPLGGWIRRRRRRGADHDVRAPPQPVCARTVKRGDRPLGAAPPRPVALRLGREPAAARRLLVVAAGRRRVLPQRQGSMAIALTLVQLAGLVDHRARRGEDRSARAGGHSSRVAQRRAADRRTVPLGAAPALFRLGADGLRCRAHDRRPAGVRRAHDRSICRRDPVGGALAAAELRRRVRALHARREVADDPVHLLKRESSSSPPV